MEIFYIILAAIASEIAFVIGFILLYFIFRLLHFLYAIIKMQNKYRWLSDGILCGSGSIFLACYVSFLITKNQNLSELSTILVGITLPLIGEIGYWKYLTKKKSVSFVDRFHIAMKVFPQRAQFAVNFAHLSEQMLLNMSDYDKENFKIEEFRDTETVESLRKEAYERTQGYLAFLFLWSLVGYIIGLFLVHHFIF